MGYRSTVIIGINSKSKKEFEKLDTFGYDNKPYFKHMKDTKGWNSENPQMSIYEGKDLKWYDGYEDVGKIIDFVKRDKGFIVAIGEDDEVHSGFGEYDEFIDIYTDYKMYAKGGKLKGFIKVSELKEYLLKDDANKNESYKTLNGDKYVKESSLRTYMKNDEDYAKGGKVTIYHDEGMTSIMIDKRDALKLLKKGLLQPEEEPNDDDPVYMYYGEEDSSPWESLEKELGYLPMAQNYAKGGKVKKGKEMLIGGLAGVLLGIFFNK